MFTLGSRETRRLCVDFSAYNLQKSQGWEREMDMHKEWEKMRWNESQRFLGLTAGTDDARAHKRDYAKGRGLMEYLITALKSEREENNAAYTRIAVPLAGREAHCSVFTSYF